MKVYCRDCKHYRDAYDHDDPEMCLAPGNFRDTYRVPKSVEISKPHLLNKFNRCKMYAEKVPLLKRFYKWITSKSH